MKRVAGLVSALFLVLASAGCCHQWGGCMPGCSPGGACPPAYGGYGGYGVTPGAVPVYPQTGAIYAPTETMQANYGGIPVAVQPVAVQTALVPLESLPTY